MKKFYFLILLSIFTLPGMFAQKIVRVEGSAQVRIERNMTENDTHNLAELLAKITAIQDAFGTTANQEFNMMIREGKADYNLMARTEIEGEWIETTSIHFWEDLRYVKSETGEKRSVKWLTCHIKGKAREIPLRAHIEFYPMNSTELSCKTSEIANDGKLYLSFKSPVDGYLSVFLDDGNRTFRLLPDRYSQKTFESGVFVKGDQNYILFSPEFNTLSQKQVEEYQLFTDKDIEYNYLYVVFSEKPFVKPILENLETINDRLLPKWMTTKKFQEWISENKYAENSFQVKQMAITIVANP